MGDRTASGVARDALVFLAAALATRDRNLIRDALVRTSDAGEPIMAEEVLLQSHLFLGFPTVLDAFAAWREISGEPAPPAPADDVDTWADRGPEICALVYARNYERLRRNVAALHPDLERWMLVGGYGRVIGRPGLDLLTRELCIVALLAVWNAPRQLHSHLRGALHAGATPEEVAGTLDIACRLLPSEQAAQVRALWERVRRMQNAE